MHDVNELFFLNCKELIAKNKKKCEKRSLTSCINVAVSGA